MDEYKKIIDHLSTDLKERGFKKNKFSFYYKMEGNIGLIEFQKSRSSDKNQVLFTINLGVSLGRLRSVLHQEGEGMPIWDQCHWKERVGMLLPVKKDHWWKVDSATDVERLVKELRTILVDVAIPAIMQSMSDEYLKENWLNGVSHGLTEFQRYKYLIWLLKLDQDSSLDPSVQKFREWSVASKREDLFKDLLTDIGYKHG